MEALSYIVLWEYVIVGSAVSLLAIVLAIRVVSIRHEARAKVAALLIFAAAVWLLMSILQSVSVDLASRTFFYKMEFVSALTIPTTWLILTMQLSGYDRWLTPSNLLKLAIVPLTTLVLIFTNDFHGLIWTNAVLNATTPFPTLYTTKSLGYYLLVVGYSYLLISVATVMFVRRTFASRTLFRRQAFPLIFVICIPWILDAIFVLNPSLFIYIDPTPLALTAASMMVLWRVTYLPGADVVPVAHELVIDNLNEAIIVLDARNLIVDLNPKAQDLIGKSLSEILGKPIGTMWSDWAAVQKVIDSGTGRTMEVSFDVAAERKTFEVQTSQLTGITSRPNQLVILRDVTDRKIVDEKLKLYSAHLEELIAERTRKLKEAERLAAIGETAAMVGHDLRNPLQAIAGAAYLLKKKPGLTTDDETKAILEVIESSVQRSNRIVSDLLEYSREPKLTLSETSLQLLVNEVLASAKIPENVRVKLSLADVTVAIDIEMMRRTFLNIITNAVEAMTDGGQLLIESRKTNGNLEISFIDTGVGIADQDMENIWKPLHTTKSKGLGLGLAICRKTVEAHEGSIFVKSTVGKGTIFTIIIPIKLLRD